MNVSRKKHLYLQSKIDSETLRRETQKSSIRDSTRTLLETQLQKDDFGTFLAVGKRTAKKEYNKKIKRKQQ